MDMSACKEECTQVTICHANVLLFIAEIVTGIEMPAGM